VFCEDIPKIIQEHGSHIQSEKLLYRLAASDEINIQALSQVLGISMNEINQNLDILAKAELLNILFPYGGLNGRIVKSKKTFFMSPSVRKSILILLYGNNLVPEHISKMPEDTVVMYLKRLLPEGMLSFTSYKKGQNPDFVVETSDKPVIIEVSSGKSSTGQIVKSKIKYRYGIVINNKALSPERKGDIIILPLYWFLML
jgi:predicted AAA+ superfamily ATPase